MLILPDEYLMIAKIGLGAAENEPSDVSLKWKENLGGAGVLNGSVEGHEVILNTEGRQLKARVELLNAPNNPKQTFEVSTRQGRLLKPCVAQGLQSLDSK